MGVSLGSIEIRPPPLPSPGVPEEGERIMETIKMLRIPLILLAILAISTMARAQTAAPNNARAPDPQSNTAPPPQPIGVVLERAGGSLARVELGGTLDPSLAGASSNSYYSVPEPAPKILKKHDLVTVIVREESQFASQGTTNLKHTQDFDAQIDSYVQLEIAHLKAIEQSPSTPMELKTSAARDFDGEATVNRSDSVTAQITAEVIDVKPNGTLVLKATEDIKTDEEEQQMTLLGTCRVDDVTADNTVLSTQLYDLSLIKKHKGAVRDTTERGFITRLLDSINPF